MGNDLKRLGEHLDEFPNVVTEFGAVIAELGRQPKTAREFFIKYQDRILFGKDSYNKEEFYTYFRVLESDDEYFDYFRKSGGRFVQEKCKDLKYKEGQWAINFNKQNFNFDEVVIAAGPWSKKLLSNLGYDIPLAWERGYHHHFSTKIKTSINPAIHDVEGGFVYSSNGSEVRITSGVELNFLDASKNDIQINESIQKLHKIIPLDKKLTEKAWLGSRPTIADSLPMIGKATKHKNLWFNFGHNHIGLSTSAGSAVILAEMIQNKKNSINTDPFSPKRFNL